MILLLHIILQKKRKSRRELRLQLIEKKLKDKMGMVKADIVRDRECEKRLVKVATLLVPFTFY